MSCLYFISPDTIMAPAGIPLLLFVFLVGSNTSSTEATITVSEETKITNEGSCVTIPCVYEIPEDKTLDLLWFKDAQYDEKSKIFNGTIVYSNTDERPQSPGYYGRVEYITNLESQTQKEQQTINKLRCDLRITNLQKTDSGNYSFRYNGRDPHKFISKAMNLTVTDNPCKVYMEPSKLKNPLKESDEFTVRCSTSGPCDSPPEWLLQLSGKKPEWTSSSSEERIIQTEEGKNGTTVTKLKLNVTWKDDNRILSCRPANSDDDCQIRNITLSVEYSPKETHASISSDNVKEGDSVTLSCTSRGRPEATYTWFKKNKGKLKQTSKLILSPVKPEDSGEYYCEAGNSHGATSSNVISINVKFGPKGVTVIPPDNINDLKEGDAVKLKCLVERQNPPASRFVWYKTGQKQDETSEIFIDREVTIAERWYKCVANNGINIGTSQELTVNVKYSPRNIKIKGETSVKEGSRLELACSADARPWPEYKWTFPPGLSFSSSSRKLETQKVTIEHAGKYTCSVTNNIGTESKSTHIYVLYPPFNLKLMMQKVVTEFEVICITCTVQSFPKSEFTVTKNQNNLLNIPRSRMNSTKSENKLTICLNVTESDAGMYKCKATNTEGQKETQQELTVLYAPKNVTASFKGDQKSASELALTCEARSNPPVFLYEWMKLTNGQFQTLGHHQKLYFNALVISDSGQYVCIAYNSIGKAKSPPLDIRVKYTPNITIVHNTTASAQWYLPVYLSCSADAHPPATEYKWYRQEDNTTVLSQQQNFTVLPQNPGFYYCTATNDIGKSQSRQIALFISSNSLRVFLKIVLPIIFLLILIVVVFFLIRRNIIKTRSDQQSGADNLLCLFPAFLSRSSRVQNLFLLGSRNNTQENLSMDDPSYAQVNLSHPTPPSQYPAPGQELNPRPKPNIQTVYAAINLPQRKQERHSPKRQQKTGNMDNTSTVNYVTLDFKKQNEPPKRSPETSVVYAMVSKNKQAKSSQAEHSDYENVSSACAPKLPLTNLEWESDTSEEEEVNYTTVSCSAKPAVKELKHNKKTRFSSSSSDNEDRTEYSDIKR